MKLRQVRRLRLPLGRRALISLAAALVVGGAIVTVTAMRAEPPPVRAESRFITVVDGPRDDQRVRLDTTFFPPAGGGRRPALLLAHGFGSSKASVRAEAVEFSRAGYAVLTWSARGFGRSSGEIALNSPDYEVKDVRQLVDWLAKRPEVRLDGAGDPRVGIAGRSYGGAISLMAAAYDRRVDAIAPQITWHDLADALFPNATGEGAEHGVFKKLWAGLFFTAGGSGLSGPGGGGAGLGGLAGGGRGGNGEDASGEDGENGGGSGGDGEGDGSGGGESAGAGGPGAGAGGIPSMAGGYPANLDPKTIACGRFRPELCEMYQRVAETGRPDREAVELLRRSSPSSVAGRIRVPTLLIQGQADSLFPLDHADANATEIARTGAPVEMVWFQGGHDGGPPETDRVFGLVRDWFDRRLGTGSEGAAGSGGSGSDGSGDGSTPGGGFVVTRIDGVDPGTRDPVITAAVADRYPGLSGGGANGTSPGARPASRRLPLTGREQAVQNPAGGSPASISAVPGLGGLAGGFDSFGGEVGLSLDIPGQAAAFDSAPLPTSLRITGAPTARIRVSGADDVTLFAKVYDVGPAGLATPVRQLAAPLRVTGAKDGREVDVRLPAIDYEIESDHRLRLVVATTDMGFATPAAPATYRIAAAGPLTVPSVPTLRETATGMPSWIWALPLIALALAVLLLVTGRRRRAAAPGTAREEARDPGQETADGTGREKAGGLLPARRAERRHDPALADVPLQITGLTKRYAGGQLAVHDLSLRVERGQVLGMLGPNGAGKTTALRMLMGLIHPDAGEIRIFGHRVVPGAPVLSRLGSFVEGPGFLPHLSGRDNLELYWRATGRPAADARIADAVEIAGLGAALDRAVRTYSQGMRQRLAIAQAMLGLPDLLVLDEPTNGLDPPQIREMREVLARYARDGRTVVVSSHLLAEVEQTCTHVVIMHRGTGIASGPVAEIVGHSATLMVGTREIDRALEVLTTLDGIEAAEAAESGVLVRLNGSAPSAVVAELVAGGVPVDGVVPQRKLEDAFLALIGEGHSV